MVTKQVVCVECSSCLAVVVINTDDAQKLEDIRTAYACSVNNEHQTEIQDN